MRITVKCTLIRVSEWVKEVTTSQYLVHTTSKQGNKELRDSQTDEAKKNWILCTRTSSNTVNRTKSNCNYPVTVWPFTYVHVYVSYYTYAIIAIVRSWSFSSARRCNNQTTTSTWTFNRDGGGGVVCETSRPTAGKLWAINFTCEFSVFVYDPRNIRARISKGPSPTTRAAAALQTSLFVIISN